MEVAAALLHDSGSILAAEQLQAADPWRLLIGAHCPLLTVLRTEHTVDQHMLSKLRSGECFSVPLPYMDSPHEDWYRCSRHQLTPHRRALVKSWFVMS